MGHPGNLTQILDWLDGYTEEIDKAPSAKQWSRIKARLKEIDRCAVADSQSKGGTAMKGENTMQATTETAAPSSPPAVPTPSGPAKSAIEWRTRYQAKLIDLGMDNESAAEDAIAATAILSEMPEEAARRDIARHMPAAALEEG